MAKRIGGRWERIGHRLGAGGQAEVDVVVDTSNALQGEFAAKVLINSRRTPRLEREIEQTTRLHSLGAPVLQIVDSYLASEPESERPWFVTPIAEGMSLRTGIRPDESYGGSLGAALRTFADIVRATKLVHSHGVAHRDLKPENILRHNGGLLLGDLGLCIHLLDDDAARLSDQAERIGSIHYLPKEAFSRQPVDDRQYALDAYALGKILYELVSGNQLLGFASPSDPAYAFPTSFPALVTQGLGRTLRGLLNDDPTYRLPILEELEGQSLELIELSERQPVVPADATFDFAAAASGLSRVLAATPTPPMPSTETAECEGLADDVAKAWESSAVAAAVKRDLIEPNPSQVQLNVVTRQAHMRQLVTAAFTRTRYGLEPLEDAGYHRRPMAESGCAVGLQPLGEAIDKMPAVWACMLVGTRAGTTAVGFALVEAQAGKQPRADVIPATVLVVKGSAFDATLPARVQEAAVRTLAAYAEHVSRTLTGQ